MDTSNLSHELVIAGVAVLTWLAHQLWSRVTSSDNRTLDAAIAAMKSVMSAIVLTAKPDATTEWVYGQLRGAADIQLAAHGLDPKDRVVKALVDQAITAAVQTFVAIHPTPKVLHDGVQALVQARRDEALVDPGSAPR